MLTNFSYIRTYQDIKDFFSDNDKALKYLDEYEDIDNMIGAGVAGRVWKIKGKELTLKITSDLREIAIAKKLIGKNLKTFLKIYKTVEVQNIQLRIQEMCYPISRNEEKFLTYTSFDTVLESKGNNLKEVIEYLRKNYLPPPDEKEEKIAIVFYLDVIKDAKKLGLSEKQIEKLDAHTGNIMKTKQGNFKLVDF